MPNTLLACAEHLWCEGQELRVDQAQNFRHGSSSTNRHTCRTRCAGHSLMPAAPRRATVTISTVTTIAVITAARRSNGPCRGRGGFADAGRPCGTAWHCYPPRARRLAAAGPPDYQPSRPVLILYSPFIVLPSGGIVCGPRG